MKRNKYRSSENPQEPQSVEYDQLCEFEELKAKGKVPMEEAIKY